MGKSLLSGHSQPTSQCDVSLFSYNAGPRIAFHFHFKMASVLNSVDTALLGN